MGWRVEETPEGRHRHRERRDRRWRRTTEGYGLTYLFGDGWVKYADTKQGLLLVVWPSP